MGCCCVLSDSAWAKAEKKAADPHMTVDGNPFRREIDPNQALVEHNMKVLHQDAHMWNDPKSGSAYRAIRSMTYNGGE